MRLGGEFSRVSAAEMRGEHGRGRRREEGACRCCARGLEGRDYQGGCGDGGVEGWWGGVESRRS